MKELLLKHYYGGSFMSLSNTPQQRVSFICSSYTTEHHVLFMCCLLRHALFIYLPLHIIVFHSFIYHTPRMFSLFVYLFTTLHIVIFYLLH